jgi:hypothetical protein
MAVAGNVPALGRWLPTTLLSAIPGLASGKPGLDYLPASAVCLVATAAGVLGAVWQAARREL